MPITGYAIPVRMLLSITADELGKVCILVVNAKTKDPPSNWQDEFWQALENEVDSVPHPRRVVFFLDLRKSSSVPEEIYFPYVLVLSSYPRTSVARIAAFDKIERALPPSSRRYVTIEYRS